MFILAVLALVASCTPESIERGDEQQIDKDEYHETISPNG